MAATAREYRYNDVTMSVKASGVTCRSTVCSKRLFRLTSNKTHKPALLSLSEVNSHVINGFPSQRANKHDDQRLGNSVYPIAKWFTMTWPNEWVPVLKSPVMATRWHGLLKSEITIPPPWHQIAHNQNLWARRYTFWMALCIHSNNWTRAYTFHWRLL